MIRRPPILGRTATAGDLVYANSHGDDNEYYVLVLELSDLPASRQTAASATLRAHYGDDHDRPWHADMIGVGIAYAVVTARFSPEVHRGVPKLLFELDGARLYDPRRDSSVGGSGPQRWSDPASWCGFGDPACENPVVQIYNIMLGLRDPVTAGPLWGGTDILQRDLPVASWFAAMNEYDAPMPADSGLEEPQYRSGIEIALEDDTEPADVIDELLKACQGQIEAAGAWVIRAGPPSAAVFAFSDDDVIVTSLDAWRTGAGGGSNVILWGTGAPTGDDGTNDDFWIDTTAWTIHGPKAAGSWPSGVALIGPAGADGDAGADGADGAAFLSGAGAPSGGTGADGDGWFDTTGRTLYGPKAAGGGDRAPASSVPRHQWRRRRGRPRPGAPRDGDAPRVAPRSPASMRSPRWPRSAPTPWRLFGHLETAS